jgi:hypothetical protein
VFGGGLASGENPENSSPDWISHPNSTFGVEADPIGWGERRSVGRRTEGCVDPTICEGPVRSAVECGHPGSSALSDEEDGFVGGEDVAVWRFQLIGSDKPRTIGSNGDCLAGLAFATVMDSAPHVTDVCRAVRRNDHVVERTSSYRREVSMQSKCSVALDPTELLRFHCNDEEAAVGQPAESRGLVVDHFHLSPDIAGEIGREDPMSVHVAEPQSFLVPTRAFAKPETVQNRLHPEALSGEIPSGIVARVRLINSGSRAISKPE